MALGPCGDYDVYYGMLSRLNVFFMLLPALAIATMDYLARGTGSDGRIAALQPDEDADRRSTRNRVLVSAVAFPLGLQLWLVFP